VKRLIGVLGWLGVALVVAAVIIRFAKPDLDQWSRGLALAGLVTTALYALSQWRDVGRSFQGRNVRYGSIAVGSVVVFLGILVAVNWIGKREHKRWDLTVNHQFSLSDQTKQILARLQKPVSIHVFYDRQSTPLSDYKDRFGEYEFASGQIKTTYVDASSDPVASRQYNITSVPTVIVEYDGRTERASAIDEQAVTNALKKAIEGQAKKAYFIQGHGEHSIDDTAAKSGYAGFAESLKNDNFDVEKLTLAQEGKIPDDASLIVIGGPKTDYLPAEVDLLRGYLRRGGKILMMVDPPDKPDSPPLANLVAFAREWDVDLGTNVVVDASGLGQLIGANEAVPIAMPAPGGHAITKDFQVMTAFPLARSATPIEGGVNGKNAQKLLETSPRSWAETDIKGLYSNGEIKPDLDKGDKMGPITIASAVSAPIDAAAATTPTAGPKGESRMVVVGDSDFISNGAINSSGNRDLGLNMANWLGQQEDLIAIRPRDPANRGMTLTADQGMFLYWVSLLIIPGLLFINAFRVWWKRR
jgi:ABC-type uncharacterized transport system involved in gliding motility auxiliary subunit